MGTLFVQAFEELLEDYIDAVSYKGEYFRQKHNDDDHIAAYKAVLEDIKKERLDDHEENAG